MARSAVGVMSKTSPMVSLNWRTLLNPAANATSASYISVATSSSRGLGAARPGQRQRAGAEFVAQDAVELP